MYFIKAEPFEELVRRKTDIQWSVFWQVALPTINTKYEIKLSKRSKHSQ